MYYPILIKKMTHHLDIRPYRSGKIKNFSRLGFSLALSFFWVSGHVMNQSDLHIYSREQKNQNVEQREQLPLY